MLLVAIKITTVMDLDIKSKFDMAIATHHKSYKDALELGALKILEEIDPETAAELRIQKYSKILNEEEEKLKNYRLLKQMNKQEVKQQNIANSRIDRTRLEKYEENQKNLAVQVNKGTIDWKIIASPNILNFKTPYEAEIWTRDQLFKDGIIGCGNCKKWDSENQYCPIKKALTKSTITCINFKQK